MSGDRRVESALYPANCVTQRQHNRATEWRA